MAAYTYVGNPDYVHNLASGVVSLRPGDQVELTDDEVAMYGDTFEPVKGAKSKTKSTAAPAADPQEPTP